MSPSSAKLMPGPAAGPLTAVTSGQCRLRTRRRNGWKPVSSAAEGAARAGQHHAADLVLLVLDRIERLGEPAEHIHGDRVHDFLMIEPQNGDRAVELERAVLELHRFLSWCGRRCPCRGKSSARWPHI